MGKGRPPKSISEHKRDGTYREDRHGQFLAPEGALRKLQPPSHIIQFDFDISREEIFEEFAGYLFNQGQSTAEDQHLLAMLVETYTVYLQAMKLVRADPSATMGRKLAWNVMAEAGKVIKDLMAEFRLTPSTRNSPIEGSGGEVVDEAEEFMKGHA